MLPTNYAQEEEQKPQQHQEEQRYDYKVSCVLQIIDSVQEILADFPYLNDSSASIFHCRSNDETVLSAADVDKEVQLPRMINMITLDHNDAESPII